MMRVLAVLLTLILALPAFAVQPDEILDDPALEARARAISLGLRCVVCRNESIDDSNAEIARDMRLAVRERLVEGDTDAQVIDFMVARFGEFVLLEPRRDGINVILWVSGPVLLLLGLGLAGLAYRRRPIADAPLSAEEEERLKKLLGE